MSLESLFPKKSLIQRIDSSLFGKNTVDILRLDLIDSEVSGNKFFKLKYNIASAQEKGFTKVLTFGGAHSNHILATAKACHLEGLESIGMIRGERSSATNYTLKTAQKLGMNLIFLDRESYQERHDFDYQKELRAQHHAFVIPEGGENFLGINGAMEIKQLWDGDYDDIFIAAGTGSTAAGIILSNSASTIYAVSALKGNFMGANILGHLQNFLQNKEVAEELFIQNSVIEDAHCGGYAKFNDELIYFIQEFYKETNIRLDPIYTGKMALAAHQKMSSYHKHRILLIHTGGLQGIQAFEQRYDLKLF